VARRSRVDPVSRAEGRKHSPRPVVIEPDSGEGREMGMSDRMQGYPSPIPGGKVHLVNAETMREKIPVPDSEPEITDLNAHGVQPGTSTSRERAEIERGPNTIHERTPPRRPSVASKRPEPVPVYIVEDASPGSVLRANAPRHFTLPAAGGEPQRLVGKDRNRVRVLLLNESTSSDIRFAATLTDLTGGGGALLPWPNNSYLTLETQDELYAISADSGTPAISIISEFELPW
jgi:hypothetical protein